MKLISSGATTFVPYLTRGYRAYEEVAVHAREDEHHGFAHLEHHVLLLHREVKHERCHLFLLLPHSCRIWIKGGERERGENGNVNTMTGRRTAHSISRVRSRGCMQGSESSEKYLTKGRTAGDICSRVSM